jgi:O-antigen ligase
MFLNADEKKYTIILVFCAVINCMGLLITTSRISLISALVACLYCIYFTDKRSVNYGKLAFIVLVSVFFVYMMNNSKGEILVDRFQNAVDQTNIAIHGDVRNFGSHRVYIYENIIKLIYESKKIAFVGVGPDCLMYYYSSSEEEVNKYPESANYTADKAHSDLIEYAATMGIPSLIFYSCFVLSILLPWFKKIKTASLEKKAIFAGWLGYLIQSMFNTPSIGVVIIFFVFSAILDG